MTYDQEMLLVLLVIALSVGYALWRIYKTIHQESNPCENCELKKKCKKFGQSKEK